MSEALWGMLGFVVGVGATLGTLRIAQLAYTRTFNVPTGERAAKVIETEALPVIVRDDAKEAQLEKELIEETAGQRPEVYDSIAGLGRL